MIYFTFPTHYLSIPSLRMFYWLVGSILYCLFFAAQVPLYSVTPGKNFEIKNLNQIQTLDSKVSGDWYAILEDTNPQELYRKVQSVYFNKNKLKKISIPSSDISPQDIPKGIQAIWLYKPFYMPRVQKIPDSLSIKLGVISDIDEAYLNEQKIGQTGDFSSEAPQYYDKIRIYSFKSEYLKQGVINHLLIRVKPFFKDIPFGIIQDSVEIGPAEEVTKDFYFGQFFRLLILMVYLSVAFYFLFLFVRRRKEFENLYFGGFAISLCLYQFLRTQIKYELGIDFLTLKKLEYSILPLLPVFFFHFIRKFFDFEYKQFHKILDSLSGCFFIYYLLGTDLDLHNVVNTKYHILLLLSYIGMIVRFMIIRFREKSLDALLMLMGFIVLVMGTIIDHLSTREIIVFPRIVGYVFIIYVMNLAVILANKFVRLNEEVEELNTGLEKKVKERTHELNQTLGRVIKLKNQQDGDYFLTSLLLMPLIKNQSKSENVKVELYTAQKKKFTFKNKDYEIGGDISISDNITLRSKRYTVFANGDAMGKSIQGAGGAIVLGVVFQAFLSRSRTTAQSNKTPELWMKEVFLEMQSVFETFDCSMMVSVFLGLVDEETGFMYFVNAEHPWGVIYRDNKAAFMENESIIGKIGMPANQASFFIKTYQLKYNDVIFAGSDGRDDIRISSGDNGGIINHDENLFREKIAESGGDLETLVSELQSLGDLTDDLTLVKVSYVKKQTPQKNSAKLQDMYEKAKDLYRGEKWDECTQVCKEGLDLDSEYSPLIRILAYVHFRNKDYEKAIDHFKDYISLCPNKEKEIYHISLACRRDKKYKEAIDYAEQVYLRNPKFMQNNLNLIKLYKRVGIKNRGEEIIEKTSNLFPGHPKVVELREAIMA